MSLNRQHGDVGEPSVAPYDRQHARVAQREGRVRVFEQRRRVFADLLNERCGRGLANVVPVRDIGREEGRVVVPGDRWGRVVSLTRRDPRRQNADNLQSTNVRLLHVYE